MKQQKVKVSRFFKDGASLLEVLQKISPLSVSELGQAAEKGAVFVEKKGRRKILRERNLSLKLGPEDSVSFSYDKKILAAPAFRNPQCFGETPHYGVYHKPAGIMPQGTQYGDHTSLLRAVELLKKKEVYLVHRLDRETEGLMLVAFTSEAAAKLGELFTKRQITKTYQAIVLGSLPVGTERKLDSSLDGQEAITKFKVLNSNETQSLLEVRIETGRLHQIRRHLSDAGLPVMGDPQYGRGNKNKEGLKLLARELRFIDPWTKKEVFWQAPAELTL